MFSTASTDLQSLASAVQVLCSPFSYACSMSWRTAAHRAVARVVGADLAAFVLPGTNEPLIACDRELAAAATDWESNFQHQDTGYTVTRAQRDLTVFHHTDIYDMSQYRQTAMYHEWVVPHRLFESFAMTVPVADAALPASINLYRTSTAQPYEAHHRLLLESLVPAFRAGVMMVLQMQQARHGLVRQLEASGAAAVLFDGSGCEVHRTTGVAHLADEPSLKELVETMRRLAQRLTEAHACATGAPRRASGLRFLGQADTEVRGRSYTLTPTLHPDLLGWHGAGVVVVAQPDAATPRAGKPEGAQSGASVSGARGPSDAALRERYGLTAREVQVARALATTQAIEEIAAQLNVSVHTLRRHSEQVYRKLGVNARREVAARVG